MLRHLVQLVSACIPQCRCLNSEKYCVRDRTSTSHIEHVHHTHHSRITHTAGAILHHTFGCCNSSCLDVAKIVIQVIQQYLLGWVLAQMRISFGRIALRLIQKRRSPTMFVLSQYIREIMFLIIASCVHYAHAMEEASPEYTKLLNVEIWDSVRPSISVF
eukprot:6169959-Prymnesium_polylepis.1